MEYTLRVMRGRWTFILNVENLVRKSQFDFALVKEEKNPISISAEIMEVVN